MKLRSCRSGISSLLGILLLSLSWGVQAAPEGEQPIFSTPPATELTPDILYQFMFAEVAAERGQMSLSVAAYLDLARSTRDPNIAKRAAEIALHAHQYEAALAATQIWVAQAPDSAAAQQMAVLLAAAFGRLDEVNAHLSRSFELAPDRVPAELMRLNGLLAQIPDKNAVNQAVINATEPYLKLPEAYFARAQAAYAAKDLAQAQTNIDTALSMRPDWELAVIFKAMLVQQQPEAVVAILQPFVKANPDAAHARIGLARALVAERKFDQALSEFKTVLAQQPSNPDVVYAVGLLSLQLHDYDTAETQLRRLVEMNAPESNLVRTYLGQLAEEKKDIKAAIDWYAGVTPSPQYIPAQARAAQLTARMGDLNAARAMLAKVKPDSDADRVQLILAEANLLREAKRGEEVYTFLNKALTERPDEPELIYETALSADSIGKFDVAEQLWQKLIKLKPDYAHAYNALGYSLADRGVRLDEAQQLIDKALSLRPDDPFILDSKGWVLFRKGDAKDALAPLEKAFSYRADPEIAAHLGEVLWSLGRKDDARKVWTDAAREHPDNDMLAATIKKFLP